MSVPPREEPPTTPGAEIEVPRLLRLSVVPLRDLRPDDKTAIIHLGTEAHGVDFGGLFAFLSDSVHVLAHLDGALVGHACWSPRRLQSAAQPPLLSAWVDAVSTAPTHQRRGIGSHVMRRLAAEIAGFDLGALGTDRLAFYERLGWEVWRGPTSDVHHDPLDTLMILRTATTPPLDPTTRMTAV